MPGDLMLRNPITGIGGYPRNAHKTRVSQARSTARSTLFLALWLRGQPTLNFARYRLAAELRHGLLTAHGVDGPAGVLHQRHHYALLGEFLSPAHLDPL
jgi:hypothetical protein